MSIALSLLATCSEALVVGPGLAPGHSVQVHRASSSIARRAAGRLSVAWTEEDFRTGDKPWWK